MNYQTFEDYLRDVHGDGYMGTDDDMPDAYENWLCGLDVEQVIGLAEKWNGQEIQKAITKTLTK